MAPPLDSQVSSLLDRRLATHDSDDEDALIAELEEDNETSALREKRLNQLHAEFAHAKALKESHHGTYTRLTDEKEVLSITTSTKLCIVHFMKPDYQRCRTMDARLSALAEKHYEARFVSIDVENAPFLVVKLGVKVLPCVLAFVEGVSVDRIVGFEGIGRREDSFTEKELEARLLSCGVLVRAKMEGGKNGGTGGRKREEKEREEEFDSDWD